MNAEVVLLVEEVKLPALEEGSRLSELTSDDVLDLDPLHE